MAAALPRSLTTRAVRLKHHWVDRLAHFLIALIAILLVAFLAGPLLAILLQALEGREGEFVWFDNFIAYAKTPALLDSLWNSVWVSCVVTLIVLPLSFTFAYALTRSCMPFKSLFRGITLIPLLAPSLLCNVPIFRVTGVCPARRRRADKDNRSGRDRGPWYRDKKNLRVCRHRRVRRW